MNIKRLLESNHRRLLCPSSKAEVAYNVFNTFQRRGYVSSELKQLLICWKNNSLSKTFGTAFKQSETLLSGANFVEKHQRGNTVQIRKKEKTLVSLKVV